MPAGSGPEWGKGTDVWTHYVVVRSDLPLGFLAAQVVHAAGESVVTAPPPDTHAIVLAVPDEAALRALADRLTRIGVPHHLVLEDAAPYTGQATALGVAPDFRSKLRRHFSALPLLKGNLNG